MTDRTAALNAAWRQLWWLLDPDHNRWAKAAEILNDPTSRLTIEQGSSDNVGRRAKGDHSDPTLAAAAAVIDAGIDGRRQLRDLQRTELAIGQTAVWLRSTVADRDWPAPSTLAEAVHAIDWLTTIPHTAAAWTTADDELRNEVDHACDLLNEESQLLGGQVLALLRGAVKEKPEVKQPKLTTCRAHDAWAKATGHQGTLPTVFRHGLCGDCWQFKQDHGVDPTPPIITRRDYGKGATPSQIAEAKAAAKTRKKKAG